MRTLIYGGVIVSDGEQRKAAIVIEDDRIAEIIESQDKPRGIFDREVDATGCFVLPGVIDSHVHFREPGLTHKADIESESRAAAFGGVTSYFDMPNTSPQTTDAEALNAKFALGAACSHVNYSFFPGATNDNAAFLRELDVHRVPGIKLFMGSSTGNMLVDRRESLDIVFALAAEKGLPVMAHCEDTDIINRNMTRYKAFLNSDDPDVEYHPAIRSAEACYESTRLGVEIAAKHGTQFHVAHITTAQELPLLKAENITAEACVAHLLFTDADYASLGTRIKCNPSVKSEADRAALREGLNNGLITTVSTDHAPHTLAEKNGGAAKAVSGMPMLQFSLPCMLTLSSEGVLSIERVVELMCHNQASLFNVVDRGYLRQGFKADIAIVKQEDWTVDSNCIQSKCGWSPLEGRQLKWRVTHTFCNGHAVLADGVFDADYRGEELTFRK